MKHQKIERIVEKRFEKIDEALDKARMHFQEDDIRIFRVKVKKLAACLNLLNTAKNHGHQIKLPQKIAKLNQIFGVIRTLQMQQKHVQNTIIESKTGSPDVYLKYISDQILHHMAAVENHIKGSQPFKKEKEKLLKVLPQHLSVETTLQFVYAEGDLLEKLFNPVFLTDQSFHEARKHLKNLLYISPYTDMTINELSPYKLLSSYEDINSFIRLLGDFHDLNITLDGLHKMVQKIEPDNTEKAILRRLEQLWIKAKEILRIKIYDELQKILSSGRTTKPVVRWPVM